MHHWPGGERRTTRWLVDEIGGTYRGVGIGADAEAVRRVFGRRAFAGEDEPTGPLGTDYAEVGGPNVLSPPCAPTTPKPGGPARMKTLRYRGASFLLCDGVVYAFEVTANEARTLRGVAVGNDLESVQSLYRSFACDEVQTGDRGSQPFCAGTVSAGRHVWFGEDPIGSITVSTTAF